MGSFYTNFTLKSADRESVVVALRKAKRNAFVAADAKTDCVVVFDREADRQNPAAISAVGKLLSKNLGRPVLAAANEDDDVFRYWLFDGGKAVDKYDSSFEKISEQQFTSASGSRVVIAKWDPANPAGSTPDWKPQPRRVGERGGNVQTICTAFGVPTAAETVLKVLLKEYDFVLDQHRAFCKALRLSPWAAGGGFEYVAAGQLPKGLRQSQLVQIGSPAGGA